MHARVNLLTVLRPPPPPANAPPPPAPTDAPAPPPGRAHTEKLSFSMSEVTSRPREGDAARPNPGPQLALRAGRGTWSSSGKRELCAKSGRHGVTVWVATSYLSMHTIQRGGGVSAQAQRTSTSGAPPTIVEVAPRCKFTSLTNLPTAAQWPVCQWMGMRARFIENNRPPAPLASSPTATPHASVQSTCSLEAPAPKARDTGM